MPKEKRVQQASCSLFTKPMADYTKLRGVVLSSVRYGESSLIVHIYTDLCGRQSFMVNGAARKGKRPGKLILFQPLSLLELVATTPRKGTLLRIKEVTTPFPGLYVNGDLRKGAIAVFLAELLSKTLREEEPNTGLFEYLWSSVQMLEAVEEGVANYHLVFMAQLTRFMGFYPTLSSDSGERIYFDIKNGVFRNTLPAHPIVMLHPLSNLLLTVFESSFSNLSKVELNHTQRNLLVEGLVDYFQHHMDGVGSMRSLAVLKEIFS